MLLFLLNRKLIDLMFINKFLIGVSSYLFHSILSRYGGYRQLIPYLQIPKLVYYFDLLFRFVIHEINVVVVVAAVVVVVLNVNIQSSGFSMTSQFHSVLTYCGTWRFFFVILQYLPSCLAVFEGDVGAYWKPIKR